MSRILYKILDTKGRPCNGGTGKWFLPKGKKPAKWMPFIKDIVPCQSGYHLCRQKDLLGWLNTTIWIAEDRGKRIITGDKVVVQQARLIKQLTTWNDYSARLFACDCARRVLSLFEKKHPKDNRPRQAIETAERFARGDATKKELAAAAWAAGAAARAAAWAARDAARADAWAAGAAAWAAAWAAGAAAWAARDARAAAWAARDARDAAWAAAGAAARDAAGDAAWAAARDAEREWQTKRVREVLQA